jgi:hypothetical protein
LFNSTPTEIYTLNVNSDASGVGRGKAGIPNNPFFIGKTYYAQVLWLWPSSYSLPPHNLSTTTGLAFTIVP